MKLRFAGCVYAAALLMAGTTGALAQDKTFELKLSHWVPPSHPLQKALEDWGSSIEKASNGTIKYKVFPAQQLGKAFDHYDMARDGIADVTYINPGYQPGRFPILAAAELPFHFTNAKVGMRALTEWYQPYAAQEMKDTYFCMAISHEVCQIERCFTILILKAKFDEPRRTKPAFAGRGPSQRSGRRVIPAGSADERHRAARRPDAAGRLHDAAGARDRRAQAPSS